MTELVDGLGEELRAFICEELGYEPQEVPDSIALFSSGLVDSFTFVGMISIIERRLGQQIDPRAIVVENFDSITRILAFLKANVD